MRNLNGHITTSHPPISVPVSSPQNFEMPSSNGSAPAPSLAITKLASSDGIGTLLDKAADEGLVIIRSPRVRVRYEYFSANCTHIFLALKVFVQCTGWLFQEI